MTLRCPYPLEESRFENKNDSSGFTNAIPYGVPIDGAGRNASCRGYCQKKAIRKRYRSGLAMYVPNYRCSSYNQ